MWSTFPPLPHQPVLDLPTGTTLVDASGACCGALHWLVGAPASGDSITVRLGERYSVRLDGVFSNEINGDGVVVSHVKLSSLLVGDGGNYVTYTVLDGEEVVASGVFHFVYAYSMEAGYVLTQGGPRMYVHIAAREAQFGAGTVHLLLPVDEADINGTLSIELPEVGGVGPAAMHHGPFVEHGIYKPDTTEDKRARQGTRVASLRSAALNFGSPLLDSSAIDETPEQTLPAVDCGGHSEFVNFDRYATYARYVNSLAGQTETNVAYIRRGDVSWSSNISPDDDENETLARISLTVAGGTMLPGNPGGWSLPEVVLTATTDGNGNNEYTAISTASITATRPAFTSVNVSKQSALVTLEVREQFDNRDSATFDGVALRTVCIATASVWFRRDDSNEVARVGVQKTLTDEEFADLLAGIPVSLADGTMLTNDTLDGDITIQGIGPA